jgi:CheY-like chemotaxis protein
VIFQTFRQGEFGNRPRFRGTGLGLAICRGSVLLLGGEVNVTSSPGQGSTFSVTLPYCQVTHPVTPAKRTPVLTFQDSPVDWSGKRLLVVEDEENNMEFLKIILARTNADLFCVRSGKALRNHYPELDQFHMVLLDVRLPDANGWELASEIKKLRPGLPVIAQTAYALSSDRKKSSEAGCDGYIAKPINKDRLFAIMAPYLQKSQESHQSAI